MKKISIICSFVLFTTCLFAQSQISKGQSQFNAGFGLSSWGLPLYIGLDYGMMEDITVGGELSYRSYSDHFFGENYKHTIIGISGNGNYHFNSLLNIPDNIDFYAGLNLGFYIWSSSSSYTGDNASRLGLGLQVGGRYYFNDKLGVNLELGGGNAFATGKLGLSFRL